MASKAGENMTFNMILAIFLVVNPFCFSGKAMDRMVVQVGQQRSPITSAFWSESPSWANPAESEWQTCESQDAEGQNRAIPLLKIKNMIRRIFVGMFAVNFFVNPIWHLWQRTQIHYVYSACRGKSKTSSESCQTQAGDVSYGDSDNGILMNASHRSQVHQKLWR